MANPTEEGMEQNIYLEPEKIPGKHRFMAGTCVDCGKPLAETCDPVTPAASAPVESAQELGEKLAGQMLENLRHNVAAERKRREAASHTIPVESVKRLHFCTQSGNIEEDVEGGYVRYSDYQALEKRCAESEALLREMAPYTSEYVATLDEAECNMYFHKRDQWCKQADAILHPKQ